MKSPIELASLALNSFRMRDMRILAAEIRGRQWWPADALLNFCDELTRLLVIHSAANVPYYRNSLQLLGLDYHNFDVQNDWKKLPILSKEDLVKDFHQLQATSCHSKMSHINHTGGSTGKPITFLSDLSQFVLMRLNMDMIFSWAGWNLGETVLHLWGGVNYQYNQLSILYARLKGHVILPVHFYNETSFVYFWKVFQHCRPTILYAYPSVAAEFARWLEAEGIKPNGIKGVFCSAETLLHKDRSDIERVFQCKAYNQYGSRETPCVACECPEGNMHLFIDINRPEFINVGKVDEPSRIIVTPLMNYSQPLLRYDLEDTGRLSAGSCRCGRGYPIMKLDISRCRDHLLARDGRRIHPGYFTRLLDGKNWIKSFQYRQTSFSSIHLALEIGANTSLNIKDSLQQLRTEIEFQLLSAMGYPVALTTQVVDRIERTSAGKHRYVINDIDKNP